MGNKFSHILRPRDTGEHWQSGYPQCTSPLSWVGSCPTPKARLWVDSNPSPKALPWVDSCHALNMLPWAGSHSPRPHFTIFEHTTHVQGLTAFLLPQGDSSLVFLPPSPLLKAVPAVGRFRMPLTPFPRRCLPSLSRAARAPQKPWLQRRPSHSEFSIPEFYTGVGPAATTGVRICLAWHSSPSVVDDAPTNTDNNG